MTGGAKRWQYGDGSHISRSEGFRMRVDKMEEEKSVLGT